MQQEDDARHGADRGSRGGSPARGDGSPDPGQSTPTPPYPAAAHGGNLTPAERLAEIRQSARRTSRSAHPDGAPAPLPLMGGAGRARGGAARVMQRFTGTGVTPRAQVQRQERRARTTTLVLAGLVVALIASSALLLFNPFVQRPGFGFGIGQRQVRRSSDIPLIVPGTEPPTPTIPPFNSPTPTTTPQPNATSTPAPTAPAATSTAGPAPTATSTPVPAPTATPRPTPTPTIVPTPTATLTPASAQVTFTTQTAAKQSSPATMTACSSGCDIPSQSTNGTRPGSYGKMWVSGYQSTEAAGNLSITLTGLEICYIQPRYCVGYNNGWPGGTVYFTAYPSSGNFYCALYVPPLPHAPPYQFVDLGTCKYAIGTNPLPAGSLSGTAIGYSGPVDGQIGAYFNWSNDSWPSDKGYYYPTPADCSYAEGQAYNAGSTSAYSAAQSAIAQWASGKVVVQQSISRNTSSDYCNPQPYQAITTYNGVYGYTNANYSGFGFTVQDAQNLACTRLTNSVDAGFIWKAGGSGGCAAAQSACSPSSVSNSGGQISLQCADSGTEIYDWNAASNPKGTLASKLVGPMTKLQAQTFCNNNYPGIVPGSCKVVVTGGDGVTMPTSASSITITPG